MDVTELVRRRPGGRTERHSQAIVEATLSLLAEKGYGALSFSDVAQAAGVNRSTLSRRWTSRADLVIFAIGQSLTVQIIPADTGSLEGDLRHVLRQVGAYVSTPLGAAVLVASLEMELSDPPDRPQWWTERLTVFDEMFDRAQARGEIPATFEREVAIALASGAIYFRRIAFGQVVDERWIDRVVAMWKGVIAH